MSHASIPTPAPAPESAPGNASGNAAAPAASFPASADVSALKRLVLASLTLWRREMVRFLRQRSRVVGALATPLVFWLLLGTGLNKSFTMSASQVEPITPSKLVSGITSDAGRQALTESVRPIGYLEYFFPGTIVMVVLFTAIFSTISVIEDRREGFMQGVLVSPAPRLAIVLGKVLGGASLATMQGVLLMAIWPIVGAWPGVAWMAAAVALMFVVGLALTALGLCVAWPMDSTAGFHAVMNLVLMPMWFLSGAVFPMTESTPLPMKALMWCNPLTYGQAAFTSALRAGAQASVPVSLRVSVGVTAAFTVAIVALATWIVSRPRKDGT